MRRYDPGMLFLDCVLLAMVVALGAFPDPKAVPSLDGRLNDWVELPPAYPPPGEDLPRGPYSLQRFDAAADGTRVWVALDFGREFNIQAGPAWEGPLCLEVLLPDGRRLCLNLRDRRIEFPVATDAAAPRWPDIDLISAPTVASDQFEVRFDLSAYAKAGDAVTISAHSSTLLAAPLVVRLGDPLVRPEIRSGMRERGTCVRIASFNTHLDGFTDPKSTDALGRIVVAAAADVYCFQEQWKTPAEEIAARLVELAPAGQPAWNVHKIDGCIIATHGQLEPVASGDDRHAAAIITVGHEPPMLVVSVHPKCCGYMGSHEDLQRIEQSLSIARTVRGVQSSHPGIPVVVIGDWNLVGSDVPMRVVREAVDPSLVRWSLRHLASTDEYTFYDRPGSFTPSVLDIVVHSPHLKRRNGFILDSTTLPDEMLTELKLQRTDSRASDHLLIVADFTLPD